MSAGAAAVLVLLLAVAALTSFRDAPNAVALPVRFGALTPRVSLVLAALLNAVGAVLGVALIGVGLAFTPDVAHDARTALPTLGVAAVVTLVWGVLLWHRRIPASSTSALLAALFGAHVAAHLFLGEPGVEAAFGDRVRLDLLVGLVLSPLLAWAVVRLVTPLVVRIGTTGTTVNVQRRARAALAVAAGASALGHGVQTGQRLGVLWVGVVAASGMSGTVPASTPVAALALAIAVAVGTLGGAWRIAWTLTERLVRLDPLRASVAAVVPAVLLFAGSIGLHAPLSSTHMTTAGIVGAGQTQSYASVRWAQVVRLVAWWVLTPVLCAAAALGLGALVMPLT